MESFLWPAIWRLLFSVGSFHLYINKRYRIPKGQSKMDNPEKLSTQSTQYEKKQYNIKKYDFNYSNKAITRKRLHQ